MKNLSLITLVLFLAACASKKASAPTVTQPKDESGISQADVDRGVVKFPGTTIASLIQGKANYESRCQSCHSLIPPASVVESKWRVIVPEMVKKVNRKSPTMAVDSSMEASILHYVVTMSESTK